MTDDRFDTRALYQIGYGLYVLTTKDGNRDNGCIVNTVMQVTSTPVTVAVAVNKQNYTCEIVRKTRVLNINSLTEDTRLRCSGTLDTKAAEIPISSSAVRRTEVKTV